MSVYRYATVDAGIAIDAGPGGEGCAITSWGRLTVAPGDLPEAAREIAAAMHEAAGLPAPVILERPDGPVDRFQGIKIGRNGDSVLLWIGGNRDALDAAAARSLAARLAILADEADREPDPAEVEELAKVLWDAMKGGPAETAARAALRWMAGKQQRGEVGNG